MLESKIENKLKLEVKKHGGMALKFVSPGVAGVPDRIVLIPNGRIVFVELEALEKIIKTANFKGYCSME